MEQHAAERSASLHLHGVSMKVSIGTLRKARKYWSERRDLNSGPLAPHASALPGCATLRHRRFFSLAAIDSRRYPGVLPAAWGCAAAAYCTRSRSALQRLERPAGAARNSLRDRREYESTLTST